MTFLLTFLHAEFLYVTFSASHHVLATSINWTRTTSIWFSLRILVVFRSFSISTIHYFVFSGPSILENRDAWSLLKSILSWSLLAFLAASLSPVTKLWSIGLGLFLEPNSWAWQSCLSECYWKKVVSTSLYNGLVRNMGEFNDRNFKL